MDEVQDDPAPHRPPGAVVLSVVKGGSPIRQVLARLDASGVDAADGSIVDELLHLPHHWIELEVASSKSNKVLFGDDPQQIVDVLACVSQWLLHKHVRARTSRE